MSLKSFSTANYNNYLQHCESLSKDQDEHSLSKPPPQSSLSCLISAVCVFTVYSRVEKGATEERNAHLPVPGHRQHAALSRSHVEEAFCQTRSTPEPVTKQNRRGGGSRRCPLAATRCSEPSNYTNLQEAVLITRNPEDVKTSSAGGLVLTTNGGKKQKQNGGLVIIINALTVTADPIIHS